MSVAAVREVWTAGEAAYPVSGSQTLQNLGPTIPVEVGFSNDLFATDPAAVQAALQAVLGAPVAATLIPALIDTGAGESCIDEELAKALNRPLIDRQPGSGVGGTDTLLSQMVLAYDGRTGPVTLAV